MKQKPDELWAVYQNNHDKKHGGGLNVICAQEEWDALERSQPGCHILIRAGITNEAEAELLARGTSGDRLGHLQRKL